MTSFLLGWWGLRRDDGGEERINWQYLDDII